jgi:hypothetical protein
MSSEPNPTILSFYQSTLIPMFRAVEMAWNAKDYNGALNALKLTYTWLPNICQDECEKEYDKVLQTLDAIGNGFKEVDITTRRTKIGIVTRNYLYTAVLHLSKTFHRSLDAHKYLEKAGVRPKYEETKTL